MPLQLCGILQVWSFWSVLNSCIQDDHNLIMSMAYRFGLLMHRALGQMRGMQYTTRQIGHFCRVKFSPTNLGLLIFPSPSVSWKGEGLEVNLSCILVHPWYLLCPDSFLWPKLMRNCLNCAMVFALVHKIEYVMNNNHILHAFDCFKRSVGVLAVQPLAEIPDKGFKAAWCWVIFAKNKEFIVV